MLESSSCVSHSREHFESHTLACLRLRLRLPLSRFVLVLDGHVTLKTPDGKTIGLKHNDYAYFPPGDTSVITSSSGAGLLLYERIYSLKVCILQGLQA